MSTSSSNHPRLLARQVSLPTTRYAGRVASGNTVKGMARSGKALDSGSDLESQIINIITAFS